MRIGFISPFWLPHHGGTAHYDHRLANALVGRGADVSVFTSTPEDAERDNGKLAVTRWTGGKLERVRGEVSVNSLQSSMLSRHYGFISDAVQWATLQQLDVALVSTPLQEPRQLHAKVLYDQLRAAGIRVGALHHDISVRLQYSLIEMYRSGSQDWDDVAERATRGIVRYLRQGSALEAYHQIGSPLCFGPDFTVSCSRWSDRFIDPLGRLPRYVLRPFIDPDYWAAQPAKNEAALRRRDVFMLNPHPRKGGHHMLNLVSDAGSHWTFRVLKGGWGDSFANFLPLLQTLPAFRQGRVELLSYVQDIRAVYRSSGVVFFPSLFEGYGMAAVEPMFAGIPVVSSNYPAVLEAVGAAAFSLCPFRDSRYQWRDAVNEVLYAPALWRQRSLARAGELAHRQNEELSGFLSFLRAL